MGCFKTYLAKSDNQERVALPDRNQKNIILECNYREYMQLKGVNAYHSLATIVRQL